MFLSYARRTPPAWASSLVSIFLQNVTLTRVRRACVSFLGVQLCSLVKALLSVHTGVYFAIFRALIALISVLPLSLALTVPRSPTAIMFVLLYAQVRAGRDELEGIIVVIITSHASDCWRKLGSSLNRVQFLHLHAGLVMLLSSVLNEGKRLDDGWMWSTWPLSLWLPVIATVYNRVDVSARRIWCITPYRDK